GTGLRKDIGEKYYQCAIGQPKAGGLAPDQHPSGDEYMEEHVDTKVGGVAQPAIDAPVSALADIRHSGHLGQSEAGHDDGGYKCCVEKVVPELFRADNGA